MTIGSLWTNVFILPLTLEKSVDARYFSAGRFTRPVLYPTELPKHLDNSMIRQKTDIV